MYRVTSPQLTITEPTFLMPGILPKDHWSFVYKDTIWPLINEDKLKHLYVEDRGAPNISIKLKISLLIFMALEEFNWRQVEEMFMCRLDWINATYTEFGKAFVDHTTLFKFYRQLEDDNSAYRLFVDLTNTFTEKDKDKTRGRVKEMARDLYLIKSSFEHNHQIRHYETFKTLVQVFEQQCVIKTKDESSPADDEPIPGKETIEVAGDTATTPEPEIEIREKPEGDKIISSPHNTDAEYTRKGKKTVVGHKGFVTETCDPDNAVQFITD